MALITTDTRRIIVGLGQTGFSCARYLKAKGQPFAVVDTRHEPPLASALRELIPDVELRCGALEAAYLAQADELILSPGVALAEPAIQAAVAAGARVIGDIDLFCREVSAPIIAITGSNAKSTVTTLVGDMAAAAGWRVGVGGNIGVPVLDLLAAGEQDLYVLELSSFQLETTHDLRARAATLLNLSPDHLDRYPSLAAYHQAKQRIYRGSEVCITNRDDALTQPLMSRAMRAVSFGLSEPDLGHFGLRLHEGESWLAQGLECLLPVSACGLRGQHNVANMLAALALGQAAGLPMEAMLQTLKSFKGLPHRCQWLLERDGVNWINDSKGTNVGASLAAINGLGQQLAPGQALVVILGGVGKEQQFDALREPLLQYARAVVLIGRDAEQIAADLQSVPFHHAASLEAAVALCAELAHRGDTVLLSPACASFDMFSGYAERGERFAACVGALP